MRLRVLAQDPRHLQIAVLAGLLVYGGARLGFDVTPGRSALILATALVSQLVAGRLVGAPIYDPRSALISGLSLCLLLRTPSDAVAALAAALAIGSKFAVRIRGKHVFNPTNFGIVATVFATGAAWISPGQWGASGILGFLLACLGMVVVHRALRSDVTFAFLGAYAALLFARALWLGDPLAIPVHQLQSGSLLLFAFFMISDPRTTPDSRSGRLVFGALVAAVSAYMQFALYRPVAALPALFLLSPLVPLFDRIVPGPRYQWPRGGHRSPVLKGADHASLVAARLAVRARAALGPEGPGVLRVLRRQGG
jgi:Na+-transporting NADH:ubiquinone oxidoreductase subunit NqrB